MAAVLQWTEPIAARRWRWQTVELPEVKKILWLFAKWSLLLGLPTLLLVYRFAPTEFPRVAIGFLVLAVFQPVSLAIQVWVSCRSGCRYSVTRQGLRRSGSSTVVFPWRSMEGYQISEHQRLPGLCVLEFKMKRRHHIHQWSFSTSQMSEQELKRAIGRYCPDSRLSAGMTLA